MKAIEHLEHVLGLIERAYATKPMRYLVGAIDFLFTWCVVFIGVGLVVMCFFPAPRGQAIGFVIGWDWRNLPGALLGLFAGIQKFRASVRGSEENDGFSSPTASNSRRVSYLAAGGIPGLQKRVARNRMIALSVFLSLILLGALLVCLHH
jgi:hypothetical protein